MTSKSRNELQGRYSGHSSGFHLRENAHLEALATSHQNALVCPPKSMNKKPSVVAQKSKKPNVSCRRAMKNALHDRLPNGQRMTRENSIRVTAADAAMLVELMKKPPAPNTAMLEAMKRYKALQA